MNGSSKADIYLSANTLYADKITTGQTFLHSITKSGWFLDISINGTVEINGIELSPGKCKLLYVEKGERTIKQLGKSQSRFLTLSLHENPYKESTFQREMDEFVFTKSMIYPLLTLIAILKGEISESDKDMSLNCYIQLLLSQLYIADTFKSNFHFEELYKVFQAVLSLNDKTEQFPLPSEIVVMTGMKKSRFQKACLAIYGEPVQKIIQHYKMAQAFKAIIIERKEINEVSSSLGYRYSPNLITAFHNYFSLTPMDAVRLRGE